MAKEGSSSELHAKRIRSNRRYFSVSKFRIWAVETFGPKPSIPVVAEATDLSISHAYRIYRGEYSPGFETLCRMCAAAGVPLTAWTSHLYYRPSGGESGNGSPGEGAVSEP